MKIVFVAHFAGSPRLGMVYGHYHLAKEWVRLGHTVTIVAASFSHIRQVQPRVHRRVTEENIDGIRYIWAKTPTYSPASKVGRVISICSFTVQCSFVLRTIEHADLVICSSHHPFAIHPARMLAKKSGARLVFEVRDLWPLTLIELGGASPRHPFIRLMQWSEDYAYRVADKVVSVLPRAADYMHGHGMVLDKFLYIPNGIELSAAESHEELPDAHKQKLLELKASGQLLVGYAGKVGLSNVLGPFLEAISKCEDDSIHAIILGDGEFLPELQEQVKRLQLESQVTFLEAVSRRQVADFLKHLDVAYVGYQRQPLYRFGVSPTKVNDYMLAALPIIYAVDAPCNVVAESGAGVTCMPENNLAIRDAILELRDMGSDARQAMGNRGKKWLVENRDYAVLAKRFLDGVFADHGATPLLAQ